MTIVDLGLYICCVLHFLALGGLAVYGLHRVWLVHNWRRIPPPTVPEGVAGPCPRVVVQLPLYNEPYVARRLIDAAASLHWHAACLEIQVLDDSDDDTCAIVDAAAATWRQQGSQVNVLRRPQRQGYKAGALAYGLQRTTAELVVVFDADFVPPADFLQRLYPSFREKRVGMVQARWDFLNRDYSLLTRLQALLLGPHFSIEHYVRCHSGRFFNFNGTAGIWRRQAIEDAGGWQADTVTEDLDLSYRAQLAGWRFVYRDDVAVPSELPVTLSAFRQQQQRWAKGSLQTACKLLPRLWRAPVSRQIKIEAGFHLLANLGWLLGTLLALTLYPAILVRVGVGPYQLVRLDVPLFLASSGAILFYFYSYLRWQHKRRQWWLLPLLPLFTLGLAPSLAGAVLGGVGRRGGVFRRTPKYGVLAGSRSGSWRLWQGLPLGRSWQPLLCNLVMAVYLCLPLLFAWQRGTWPAVPLLLIFPLGFAWLVYLDSRELLAGFWV